MVGKGNARGTKFGPRVGGGAPERFPQYPEEAIMAAVNMDPKADMLWARYETGPKAKTLRELGKIYDKDAGGVYMMVEQGWRRVAQRLKVWSDIQAAVLSEANVLPEKNWDRTHGGPQPKLLPEGRKDA